MFIEVWDVLTGKSARKSPRNELFWGGWRWWNVQIKQRLLSQRIQTPDKWTSISRLNKDCWADKRRNLGNELLWTAGAAQSVDQWDSSKKVRNCVISNHFKLVLIIFKSNI